MQVTHGAPRLGMAARPMAWESVALAKRALRIQEAKWSSQLDHCVETNAAIHMPLLEDHDELEEKIAINKLLILDTDM